MRRFVLIATLLSFAATLVLGAGAAQAVVVDMKAMGATSVPFAGAARTDYTGVAMLPGTRSSLASVGVPVVMPNSQCHDPALPSDLQLSNMGLCWQGGPVMHRNETFAVTWDPDRKYWEKTRNYVEQFLGDVAAGSGTLTSPYALTGQYSDAQGHAANSSLYGGGCIDFGQIGGVSCKFGNTTGGGPGDDYPFSGCPVTGSSYDPVDTSGQANIECVTDGQVRAEVQNMAQRMSFISRTRDGYTPVVMVLLPPRVEACLDGSGTLCSANSSAAAQFCSYHSQVQVGGTEVSYVVQPWTPYTNCDEPDVPALPTNPTPLQVSVDAGERLVNPLSQGHIASIVNPNLNAWMAHDGSEVNDNDGCVPDGIKVDVEVVGTSSQNPYWLQREFNNGGVIETDPFAEACAPMVYLQPAFVAPSATKPGDVVDFDGSATISSLIIPKSGYRWSFGDGTTAIGPSVGHTYAKPGQYSVKLTVVDRGGNASSLTESLLVEGPTDKGTHPWAPRIQIMPQGLRSALRSGVSVHVTSSKGADGIATLLIPRGAARHAHIKAGRNASVVVGRGTISGIRSGTTSLHLHVSHKLAAKLRHLKHLTVTVRLSLYAVGGAQRTVVAAGRY